MYVDSVEGLNSVIEEARETCINKLSNVYSSIATKVFDIVNEANIKSCEYPTENEKKSIFLNNIKTFLIKAPVINKLDDMALDIHYSNTEEEKGRTVTLKGSDIPNIFTDNMNGYINRVYEFIDMCFTCTTDEKPTTIVFQKDEDLLSILYLSEKENIWKYNKIETFKAGE